MIEHLGLSIARPYPNWQLELDQRLMMIPIVMLMR